MASGLSGSRIVQRLRGLWMVLWRVEEPIPNAECPTCRRPVVVASQHGGSFFVGPLRVAATHDELVAACIVHGRTPFNDQWVRSFERPTE